MITLREFANDCQETLYRQLALPIYEASGTSYCQTGVPHPLLNGVVRCKTANEHIEKVVLKIIKHFKESD